MSLTIGSMTSTLMMLAQAQTRWTSQYNKDEQQISTGLRVNSPADDPANWARIQNLNTQIGASPIIQQGLQDGINRDATMESTLTSLSSSASTLSGLAVQYTQSGANTTSIESQASSVLNSMVNQMSSTTFNGTNPFSQGSISFETSGNGSISESTPQFNIVHNATNPSNYDITLNNGTVLSNQTVSQVLSSSYIKSNLTDQLSAASSSLGGYDTVLKGQKTFESNQLTNMKSELSNLQDANVAQVTSDAATAQTMASLNASLFSAYTTNMSNMLGTLFSAKA